MKRIPISYTRNSFTYTLVQRMGDVALYRATSSPVHREHYEVVIVRIRVMDNELTGAKAGDEYLPSTYEWGRYGWTYRDKESADQKIKYLVEESKRKLNNHESRMD